MPVEILDNTVHAGGIIITEDPVWMSSGIMASNSGEFITAFELHDCEKLGERIA